MTSPIPCFETYETNYKLQTTGVHATIWTVETGKQTIGISADTRYRSNTSTYGPYRQYYDVSAFLYRSHCAQQTSTTLHPYHADITLALRREVLYS